MRGGRSWPRPGPTDYSPPLPTPPNGRAARTPVDASDSNGVTVSTEYGFRAKKKRKKNKR
jgi:hypothetical protein